MEGIQPQRACTRVAEHCWPYRRAENLLTEVHAILVYLARTNPSAELLPTEPVAEARCIEWMNWLASNVHAMSYAQIWRPQRFTTDENGFPAVRTRGKENVSDQYVHIESLLSDGRQWAVPKEYTVVDAYHRLHLEGRTWPQHNPVGLNALALTWRQLLLERLAVFKQVAAQSIAWRSTFEEAKLRDRALP
jgi:glutathione S-transferase